MTVPPKNKTIHSEYPEKSDELAKDLENHVRDVLQSKSESDLKSKMRDLYNFLKKHRLDIESQCKKNGWKQEGLKNFSHSLDCSLEFSHEYLTSFPKETPKHLIEKTIDSSEELLFFLNNDSN